LWQEALGVASINLTLCDDWPLWRDRRAPELREQIPTEEPH